MVDGRKRTQATRIASINRAVCALPSQAENIITNTDQTKVLVAKAKSSYAVAKEMCDDQTGNAKDVCVKEAKAVEVKALADAKMGKKIDEAKKEASDDKIDANYKLALEKCDALAGDAKTSCGTAAKAKFGKS